jgi:hypothetical protein
MRKKAKERIVVVSARKLDALLDAKLDAKLSALMTELEGRIGQIVRTHEADLEHYKNSAATLRAANKMLMATRFLGPVKAKPAPKSALRDAS